MAELVNGILGTVRRLINRAPESSDESLFPEAHSHAEFPRPALIRGETRGLSWDENKFYERVNRAIETGATPTTLRCDRADHSWYIIGSMLNAARGEVLLYARSLAAPELNPSSQSDSAHLPNAMIEFSKRGLLKVVVEQDVSPEYQIRQLLSEAVKEGCIELRILSQRGKQKLGQFPHFAVADSNLYRLEVKRMTGRATFCASNPTNGRRLAEVFRKTLLNDQVSLPVDWS